MLYLPAKAINQISEGGKSIAQWKGIKQENGSIIIPLESGSYSFEIKE